MNVAIDILCDLIRIPSVSSLSNLPIIDYVLQKLDERFWKISKHPFTDENGTAKVNLIATTKAQAGIVPVEFAMVCHTDTVPFDPGWAEAVSPRKEDGKIIGRGACDVKGFLACALTVISKIDLSSLSKPLQLVLTADEEIGCVGAKRLAAAKLVSPRYMVVGEPTSLQPVVAGKGYGLGRITVTGQECHSAYPSRGRSAIFDAARVLTVLECLATRLSEERDDRFDPPYSTLNVGLISGGTAKNIVAGECSITVEWRPLPSTGGARIIHLIEEELAVLRGSVPGLNANFSVLRDDPAFAQSRSSRVADFIASLSGKRSTTISFGSEAPHLGLGCEEAIVFGPGDMTVAHRTGEYVATGELDKCVEYLESVITAVCA